MGAQFIIRTPVQPAVVLTNRTMASLESAVGGLSQTGKMPWLSSSFPAQRCKVGAKLRAIPGSVCSTCYALKGNYALYPAIFAAQEKRHQMMISDLASWADNMATLISSKASRQPEQKRFFRFHDAGDLQSLDHLRAIVAIALAVPSVRFWLPTKEKSLLKAFHRAHGDFPQNLVVRLSGAMIGDGAPNYGHTSTVSADPTAVTCKAVAGVCGDCRTCWDGKVANVTYKKH